jgi:acetyl-CoA carboxylase biotin carboxyl carrier protein
MPAESSDKPQYPEVEKIRQLVRLMMRYDLTAIDLGDGPSKIRLRRRGGEPPPSPAQAVAPPSQLSTPATSHSSAAGISAAPAGTVIESPMVGTFYASSAPESPPFVSVGSQVRSETTVCIIEAMKVFTEIPAGLSGTITEVLVKNGQPVEFGQPLFRVSQE